MQFTTRRSGVTLIAILAIFVIVPAAYAAWNRCGPPAKTAKQWKKNAKRSGTWNHVTRIVRKHAKAYHFHPVDGDTVDSWFNRQVTILPIAHAGTIPNTACNGMRVKRLSDKQVAKGWPLVVALPDQYTVRDVRSHKTKRFNKRIPLKVTFLGQASCINGTSEEDTEQVIAFVKKVKKAKPESPCVCAPESPKPPKPTPPPAGDCNGNNSNTGNGSAGNCNVNVCVGQNVCNTPTPTPTPSATPTINVVAVTHHDVEGGNTVDLCATITRDDGVAVDPKDITFSPDEGTMEPGSTPKKVASGDWCQGWNSSPTTMDHDVRWTVYYKGKQDSNVMHVLASDW